MSTILNRFGEFQTLRLDKFCQILVIINTTFALLKKFGIWVLETCETHVTDRHRSVHVYRNCK